MLRENFITQHVQLSPLLNILLISKQQLASATIVRYTVHNWEIYSKKDIKLFTQPLVKTPDELLGLSGLGTRDKATVKCLQAESTKTCVKQQNVMT